MKTQLRPATPPRSPERANLAAAIARYVAAKADVDRIEAAREQKTEIGLDARLKTAEQELTWSRSLRDQAHRDAIRSAPEMAALCERYNALCREVAILSQIIAVDYAPDSFHRNSLANYSDLPTEEASAWRAAIEAMKLDADASLPAPRITEIRRIIVDPTAA